MQEVSEERDVAIAHLSRIVDKLIEGNSLYQEKLDKEEIMKILVNLVDKFSPEFVRAIPNNELIDRIDSILVIEAVSGTLNDLTPEQIRMFDEAVEGEIKRVNYLLDINIVSYISARIKIQLTMEDTMHNIASHKHELINRIASIVDQLFQVNSLYQVRLDKEEMMEMLVNLFGKFSPEEMRAIPDNQLTDRIDSILVLEAVSGTLNDLTPEQIEIFDAVVEGRKRK